MKDIAASSQQRYMTCTTMLESIFTERDLFTDNDVEKFCTEYTCPQYMFTLNKRMFQDCNLPNQDMVSTYTLLYITIVIAWVKEIIGIVLLN